MAIASFVKYGIPVYIPFGDNEKADLIVDIDGNLKKIQVKTSIKAENGIMSFDLTSCTEHRNGGNRRKYGKDEVDYFFLYNIERDKAFLIETPSEPMVVLTIRYEKPKNNQRKDVRFENDYLFENVIKQICSF